MNKTYGENQGYPWIDWDAWLGEALLGNVSSENERVAILNADDWSTDPIGMSGYSVERQDGGEPVDPALRHYGMDFLMAVRDRDYPRAITIFRSLHDYLATTYANGIA